MQKLYILSFPPSVLPIFLSQLHFISFLKVLFFPLFDAGKSACWN